MSRDIGEVDTNDTLLVQTTRVVAKEMVEIDVARIQRGRSLARLERSDGYIKSGCAH